MNEQYVHFGCGLTAPTTWRNFDVSPTLRLQQVPVVGNVLESSVFPRLGVNSFPTGVEYGDVVKGLPVKPGTCKAIYCSHVLEHLSLADMRQTLRNVYTYLEPNGIFRFVLPDLEYLTRQYLASTEADAARAFMEHSYLGKKARPRGLSGLMRNWLGNSNHLWMWDYKSMEQELAQAGFRNIRRAQYDDSTEPRFHDVEEPGRWENHLGVECIK